MIRQPITKWFVPKEKSYIPEYFHFTGKNSEFLDSKVKGAITLFQVKWKGYKGYLNITCSKKVFKRIKSKKREQLRKWKDSSYMKIYKKDHIPILKSCLQKAVRRKKTDVALRTTVTLLCLDPVQVLRRLPIIMVEDALCHPELQTLVWLMAVFSQKEYEINDWLVSLILNRVEFICQMEGRETLTDEFEKVDLIQLLKSSEIDPNLLWALQLRKSYGGMKGDMWMLDYHTFHWYHRIKDGFQFEEFSPNLIDIGELGVLPVKKILPSAIDFHCTNIAQIVSGNTDLLDKDIKKAIWHHRSGINVRKIVFGESDENLEYRNVWKEIKDEVEKWSKIIIKNRFKISIFE